MGLPLNPHPSKLTSQSFIPDGSNLRLLRNALGCFGTGVTIVTASGAEGPVAITVNSFASVSLSPPLVLWSLDRSSSRYACFAQAKHYSIHILHAKQESLCMEVARDPTRIHEQDLDVSDFGVPVLREYMVRFDCSMHTQHEAGDHLMILGRVQLTTSLDDDQAPLTFYQGKTGTIATLEAIPG